MRPETLAEEFISIGRAAWFTAGLGRKLHAVRDEAWTGEHRAEMEQDWVVWSSVRLSCGRLAGGVQIPGVFTRMGADRCKGCCRATGMPEGKGSPKNDKACRAILGLPADGVIPVRAHPDGVDR